MVKGIVIPTEANDPPITCEVNTLEDYQAVVGGCVEPVDIQALGVTVYVNEEGLLRHLAFNSRATFLWWYNVPRARRSAMLVGPALIVGLPNRNGDSTDIPTDIAELLTKPGTWRVEVRVHGDPTWYGNQATYDDYFEALIWAMVILERWTQTEDVRVVPVDRDDGAEQDPAGIAA